MSYTYKLRLSALSLVWMFAVAFLCITAQATTTTAAPCCEDCDAGYDWCTSQCDPNDTACLDACWNTAFNCWRHCVFCSK